MKTIYAAVFFIISSISLFSQDKSCEFTQGDFEVWEDFTEAFSDDLPANTIIVPENAFPFLRFFIYILEEGFLDGIFNVVVDQSLLNEAILGIERTEDAASGQYALKMNIDSMVPTSDLLMFGICGSNPDTLYFEAKHLGPTVDSVQINCFIASTSSLPLTNEGSVDQTAVSKFVSANFTASSNATNAPYQSLAIPLTEINPNIDADTVVIWIILDGQEPPSGQDYGCIFLDNFRFSREGRTTSTEDFDIQDNVHLFPNASQDYINIESNGERLENLQIFDISGRNMYSIQGINTDAYQVDISSYPVGQYAAIVKTNKGLSTKRFVKIE